MPVAPAGDALALELELSADESVGALLGVPAAAGTPLALPISGEVEALAARGGLAVAPGSEGEGGALPLPQPRPPSPPALVALGEGGAEGEAAPRGEAEEAALALGVELERADWEGEGEGKELRESLEEGERVPGALALLVGAEEAEAEGEGVGTRSVGVGRGVALGMPEEGEGEGDTSAAVGVPAALALALTLKVGETVGGKREAEAVTLRVSAPGGEALGESAAVGLRVARPGDCEGQAEADGEGLAVLLLAPDALTLGLPEGEREGAPLRLSLALAVED